MSLIPAIHSWNLMNYARRINPNSTAKNEFFWSCLNSNETSLKLTITPTLQLMIISSDQCIEELFGNHPPGYPIDRFHIHLQIFG